MQPPPPLADVGTCTDGVSVMPDAGSELPADSDKAAAVRAAPLDEDVENALEEAGLDVRQSWFQTDSEVLLPLLDDHSMWDDFVWPDAARVIQRYMSTDVRGDDRFLPGVTDCVSLDRQKDLDSHAEEHWEHLFFYGNSAVACVSDWRGVLDCPISDHLMLHGRVSSVWHTSQ